MCGGRVRPDQRVDPRHNLIDLRGIGGWGDEVFPDPDQIRRLVAGIHPDEFVPNAEQTLPELKTGRICSLRIVREPPRTGEVHFSFFRKLPAPRETIKIILHHARY